MYRYHPFYPSTQRSLPPRFQSVYPFYPRDFTPVSTKLFKKSAEMSLPLIEDARLLMKNIIVSKSFSNKLMDAAQKSDSNAVNSLVLSIGMQSQPKISYNPDGLSIVFLKDYENVDCCKVNLALRWR
ncbi:hypothetical protein [Bacillus sp. 2205SS5-2]|uniref:hypothetical protein n=1 Tax=Bacillus sp. 2205SS5-2 TaxID=3109031 RepID=UPI003007867E